MALVAIFDTSFDSIYCISYALAEHGHRSVTNIFPEKVQGQIVMKIATDPIKLVTSTLMPKLVDGQAVRFIPDLFIIDFLNLDGEKIMSMLRQIRSTKDVPVIALSHKGPNIDRRQLLEVYGTHYVAKPFNVWKLLERVESFLGVTC